MGPVEVAIILIWLGLAWWVSGIAARKGQSRAGFFVFAVILWPVALIVALLMRPTTGSGHGPSQG